MPRRTSFFAFNRDDLRVLLLLIALLSLFSFYVWAHNRPSQPSPEPSIATSDSLAPQRPAYPGPPPRRSTSEYQPKLRAGATIDLNSADSLLLLRVPGIGPAFARRIIKHREALGGYYCVEQLQEVYGMDRERYTSLAPYMQIRTAVRPIYFTADSLAPHPYLSYKHRRVLQTLITHDPPVTWEKVMRFADFSHDDSLRLCSYLRLIP